MRAKIALLAMATLVGCAATPKEQEYKAPVPLAANVPVKYVSDPRCEEYATYVRAVAVLRDMDVRIKEVNLILPKMPPWPIDTIQREVYTDIEYGPGAAQNKSYVACMKAGFEKTIMRLDAEEVRSLLIRAGVDEKLVRLPKSKR